MSPATVEKAGRRLSMSGLVCHPRRRRLRCRHRRNLPSPQGPLLGVSGRRRHNVNSSGIMMRMLAFRYSRRRRACRVHRLEAAPVDVGQTYHVYRSLVLSLSRARRRREFCLHLTHSLLRRKKSATTFRARKTERLGRSPPESRVRVPITIHHSTSGLVTRDS